jgi:hypothetical protein
MVRAWISSGLSTEAFGKPETLSRARLPTEIVVEGAMAKHKRGNGGVRKAKKK